MNGNATVASAAGQSRDVVMAVGFLGVLTAMIIPLPTFMMDVGLSCSICLALVTACSGDGGGGGGSNTGTTGGGTGGTAAARSVVSPAP